MEIRAGAEICLTRAVALYALLWPSGLRVEGSRPADSLVRPHHQDGVLPRLAAPGRPGKAGAHAVDGLAGVSSLVQLGGVRAGQLTVRSALLQQTVGLPALVRDVAPVESPYHLGGGDSHGRAVDDEGETLVYRDQRGRRHHDDGRS